MVTTTPAISHSHEVVGILCILVSSAPHVTLILKCTSVSTAWRCYIVCPLREKREREREREREEKKIGWGGKGSDRNILQYMLVVEFDRAVIENESYKSLKDTL